MGPVLRRAELVDISTRPELKYNTPKQAALQAVLEDVPNMNMMA